jgi:hypothetical protein
MVARGLLAGAKFAVLPGYDRNKSAGAPPRQTFVSLAPVSLSGRGPEMRAHTVVALVVTAAIGTSVPALAAPVTYAFSGSLTVVDPELAPPFAVGDLFSGTFTFDPTSPDVDNVVNAYFIPATIAGSVGAYEFSGSGDIVFIQDAPFPTDVILVNASADGNDVNGLPLLRVDLRIASGDLGLDVANPPKDPLLTSLPGSFMLQFANPQPDLPFEQAVISGTVTSVAAVPEPGALLLILSGSLIAWKRSRSARTRRS